MLPRPNQEQFLNTNKELRYSSKAEDRLSLERVQKSRAHHRYKKNIATTDCLQAGYSITRQPVISIFYLYLWYARFFFSPAVRTLLISSALISGRQNSTICMG